MKKRTAIVGGERLEVIWSENENLIEATVNGRVYKLEMRRFGTGGYWFGCNGRSAEAVVVQRTPEYDGYDVSIYGHRIAIEFLDSARRLRRQGSDGDAGAAEIRAPMPGKIVRVLRGKGEHVDSRQGIVVMEAMKMQNEIRSPKRGTILELCVREGDAVTLGDLIARVE